MVRCTVTAACLIWISVNFVSAREAASLHNGPNSSSHNIFSEDHIEDSIRLALANHVICPHGWIPALSQGRVNGLNEPICLQITGESKSWGDARNVCRQNKGFLIKMESTIQIESLLLNQFMDDLGIHSYWTGMHEDDSKLIWDEMRPAVIQTFVGKHAGLGELKRGWSWNKSTLEDIDESCGMVFLKQTDTSHDRRRRSDGNKMGFPGLSDSDDNNHNPYNNPGDQDQPEMKNQNLLFLPQSGQNITSNYINQLLKRQQEARENGMTAEQNMPQSDISTQVPTDPPQTTEANGNDDDSPDPSPESNKDDRQDVSTSSMVLDTTSGASDLESTSIGLDSTTDDNGVKKTDVESTTHASVVRLASSSTTTSATKLSKETSIESPINKSRSSSSSSVNSTSDAESNESSGNSTSSQEESIEDIEAAAAAAAEAADSNNTLTASKTTVVTSTDTTSERVTPTDTPTTQTTVVTSTDKSTVTFSNTVKTKTVVVTSSEKASDTVTTTNSPTSAETVVVTSSEKTSDTVTNTNNPTKAETIVVTSTKKTSDAVTTINSPTTAETVVVTSSERASDTVSNTNNPTTTETIVVTNTEKAYNPTTPATTTSTEQTNDKSLTSRTRRYTPQTQDLPITTSSSTSMSVDTTTPVSTAYVSLASPTSTSSATGSSTSAHSTSSPSPPPPSTSSSPSSSSPPPSLSPPPSSSSPPPPASPPPPPSSSSSSPPPPRPLSSLSSSSSSSSSRTTAAAITSIPRSSSATSIGESSNIETYSDEDSVTAATEKTFRTTMSPTFLGSTVTQPPKKQNVPFSFTIVPTRFQTAPATNYITELMERVGIKPTQLPFTKAPVIHHALEASMNLQDCSEKHSSVCYKLPIQFLKRSLLCGPGWLGHPDVDKCYKVSPLPMTFYNARKRCIQDGGILALADSDFHGNTSALALLYHRTKTRIATSAWVDVEYTSKLRQNGNCSYLDEFELKSSGCNRFLPAVCEKRPQYFLAHDDIPTLIDDAELETRFMLSSLPGTLLCPLTSSSPDQEIMWVKDGTLIPETRPTGGYGDNFRGSHLRLDSKLMRRLGQNLGEIIQPSRLQGVYWCQMWTNEPFRIVKSNKFLVVFNDVITLHGVAKTNGIPQYDAALLNYMNTASGIPLTMTHDLSAINHNISMSLHRLFPEMRNVVNVVKSVDTDSGEVSFYTYVSLRDPILDNAKAHLVSSYLDHFENMLQQMDAEIAYHWNMKQPVVNNIQIRRTDACSPTVLTDEETGHKAQFQSTRIGQRADSVGICGARPSGIAVCKGDHQTGAYWDDWHVITDCNESNFRPVEHDDFEPIIPPFNALPKEPFIELDEVEIEDANVVEVTNKLANILEKTSVLTEADIDACAQVIKRIVDVNPRSDQVGKQLVSTVNKILDLGDDAIAEAEKKTKAASTIIDNLEQFAAKSKLGTERFARFVSPNIALEMWDLREGMKPVIGLGATVADDWDTPLSQPRILTIRDRSDDMLVAFDVAIELPTTLVQNTINASTNTTRLSMLIYRKVGLFAPATPLSNSSHGVLNSAVIAASLGGKKIVGLEDKVRLVFRPFVQSENRLRMTKCVFWDFSLGGWSNQGCYYNGSKYGKDICLCDHLTNFAVLLDFYGHSKPIAPEHELTLSIITLVGLGLSILGLSLTIISFVFFKKLRKGRAQLTLFNMALALVAANLVFLVGIKQTANFVFCLAVSMLLHYLILVAFMWMLVEAVLQYFTFVKVLNSYISRYALKSSISAWGLPLIPVIAVLSVDYTLYRGRPTYCWLGLEAFYYAFALPVGVIILINIVMFVVVLVSIIRRPEGLRNNQSKHKRASTNLKAAITVFVLLGLTWTFGYLAIEDARLTFQYVFTLLSSLQGFFIFILMVARRPQVREQWKAVCCKTSDKGRTPKNVSPTNSNSASSRGSDVGVHSNGSSRPLVSSSSISSMTSSCGNASFVSNSFMNRSFNECYDSMYNVHPRRNITPYQNLQDKPFKIKE